MRPGLLRQVGAKVCSVHSICDSAPLTGQSSFILYSISPYLRLPNYPLVWGVHGVRWFTKRVVWFALFMLIQFIQAIQHIRYSEIPWCKKAVSEFHSCTSHFSVIQPLPIVLQWTTLKYHAVCWVRLTVDRVSLKWNIRGFHVPSSMGKDNCTKGYWVFAHVKEQILVPAAGGVAARRTLKGGHLLLGAAESEMGAEAPPYWKVL